MGNAIKTNDRPSVGGSKETRINIKTIAWRRLERRKRTVVKPVLMRKVMTMGNSNTSPRSDAVSTISETNRVISQ